MDSKEGSWKIFKLLPWQISDQKNRQIMRKREKTKKKAKAKADEKENKKKIQSTHSL